MIERRVLRPSRWPAFWLTAGCLMLASSNASQVGSGAASGGAWLATTAVAAAVLVVQVLRRRVVVDDAGVRVTIWRTRSFAWSDVRRLERVPRWGWELRLVPRTGRAVPLPVLARDHHVVHEAFAAVRAPA
jgi:hypothetical protein